jgi:prepilin-type N-terminal cleavage/methylation domain-containing protein
MEWVQLGIGKLVMIKIGDHMKGENGFTLAELLVAMVVGLLVMTAAYATYMTQSRSYKTNEAVTALQQNLRSAMYHLERELRMAGYNPSVSGTVSFGFTNIAEDTVTFTMDSNGNGVLDTTETITYARDGTNNTLTRNAGAGAQDLALDITDFALVYINENGAAAGSANDVRAVNVSLTASDGDHTRTLSTRIRCRNLGL